MSSFWYSYLFPRNGEEFELDTPPLRKRFRMEGTFVPYPYSKAHFNRRGQLTTKPSGYYGVRKQSGVRSGSSWLTGADIEQYQQRYQTTQGFMPYEDTTKAAQEKKKDNQFIRQMRDALRPTIAKEVETEMQKNRGTIVQAPQEGSKPASKSTPAPPPPQPAETQIEQEAKMALIRDKRRPPVTVDGGLSYKIGDGISIERKEFANYFFSGGNLSAKEKGLKIFSDGLLSLIALRPEGFPTIIRTMDMSYTYDITGFYTYLRFIIRGTSSGTINLFRRITNNPNTVSFEQGALLFENLKKYLDSDTFDGEVEIKSRADVNARGKKYHLAMTYIVNSLHNLGIGITYEDIIARNQRDWEEILQRIDEKTESKLQGEFKGTLALLSSFINAYRECEKRWQVYKTGVDKIKTWLEQKIDQTEDVEERLTPITHGLLYFLGDGFIVPSSSEYPIIFNPIDRVTSKIDIQNIINRINVVDEGITQSKGEEKEALAESSKPATGGRMFIEAYRRDQRQRADVMRHYLGKKNAREVLEAGRGRDYPI